MKLEKMLPPIIFCEEQIEKMKFKEISRAGSWFLYGLGSERYMCRRERVNNHWQYVCEYAYREKMHRKI